MIAGSVKTSALWRDFRLALVLSSVLAGGLAFSSSALASSAPSEVLTGPAEGTANGFVLKGELNPGGLPTTYYFEYSANLTVCDEGCPFKTAVAGPLTGSALQEAPPVEVTGVFSGEKYRYRLIASNADGTTKGEVLEFTVPVASAPSIESESVSHVTSTDAMIEAQINPEDLEKGVYYQFQVVKNTSEYVPGFACPPAERHSSFCPPATNVGALPIESIASGTEGKSVSLNLADAGGRLTGTAMTLEPGTTYHYRVIAARAVFTEDSTKWEGPILDGPDQTFTTPPAGAAPVIESVSLSHVTPTDATLETQINSEGLSTVYQFHLVMQPLSCMAIPACLGQTYLLPSGLLLGSFLEQSVSVDVKSAGVRLQVGREYAYWVSAISTAGTTEGAHQMFRVPSEEVEPLSTTTSSPSGTGQPAGSNGGNQPAGSGDSSSTPSVKSLGKTTIKLKSLTNAQKRSKALKVCAKKSKSKRAACQKQAREKYATAIKKTGRQASRGKT